MGNGAFPYKLISFTVSDHSAVARLADTASAVMNSMFSFELTVGASSTATPPQPHIPRRYVRAEDAIRSRFGNEIVHVIRDTVEVREEFEISISGTLYESGFPEYDSNRCTCRQCPRVLFVEWH